MSDWAIIFDVDGVLLELTRAEEELFFEPFAKRIDATVLSRDWNSYAIRNDEEIVKEIVARYQLPPSEAQSITAEYLALLERRLAEPEGQTKEMARPIEGAAQLLAACAADARLGIATANLRRAAELRLLQAGMWQPVSRLAFGADGGGHKSAILARAIAASGLPTARIIFIGDNVNDVVAGDENGVHFIGFSTQGPRLSQLREAGARLLAGNHDETRRHIEAILSA